MSISAQINTFLSSLFSRREEQIAEEGWALFDVNGSGHFEIQRDDELALFESDDEALAFVRQQADCGSKRHIDALAIHQRDEAALKQIQIN